MVNITNFIAEITAPNGLWPSIFKFIEGFVLNYGWTVVLFTLFVKLLLSPFDFYTRYSTKKNNYIQKRLSGQVLKINQKYANNKEEANRQVAALYKKEGYNMIGTCVFMLINMVVTLVVFFGFFNSLREISAYKLLNQYDNLSYTYNQTLTETGSTEDAEAKTLELYLDINEKNNWLWIENIWLKDSKVSSIPAYTDLVKVAKESKNEEYQTFVTNVTEAEYNKVMKSVQSKNREWNGYFILAVLVILTSLLQQKLTEKTTSAETKTQLSDQNQQTMKMMKLILPIILLIFVLSNTASFGIYILVGNIWGILTNLLYNILVKKLTKKEEEKYLDYIQKESLKNHKKPQQKPKMVTYKNLGDRL